MALAAHWRQPGPLVLSIFLLSLCRLALFLPTLPPSYSSLLFPMTPNKIVLSSVWQSHHHEEEKRALRGEIIVLNNHLMEAKITINKLREDNVSVHNCLVWYRLPQIWTFTVWGDILGCFQTSKLKIRYFGCERSLEVAAPTPSTVQIFKFRFVQALRQPTAQKVLDIWASVGHGRVHVQDDYTEVHRQPRGLPKSRGQGCVEQGEIIQWNVSFFFEVISLIWLQGSPRDGFDFSLFGLRQVLSLIS